MSRKVNRCEYKDESLFNKFVAFPPCSFGWDYSNKCQIGLTDILMELKDGCDDTVLYDVYIQNGVGSLYPIPVVISPNYQSTSNVNSGG